MIQHKKSKSVQKTHKTTALSAYRPLVITGYTLFALLLVSVIFSTIIPFGTILFRPENVQRFNVGLFLITLTIGALLPTILGYSIGDRAIKTKHRMSHHFNGMLFGLLAFWIMITPMSLSGDLLAEFPNVRLIVQNLIPSIAVVIVTSLLAIAHARSRQAQYDLIEYKPFSITLIVAILSLPIASIRLYISSDVDTSTVLPFVIPLVLGLISYATLWRSNLTQLGKITWAAVSVSVGFVASYILGQLIPSVAFFFNTTPSAEEQMIISNVSLMVACIGWAIYWVMQVRVLSKKQHRAAPGL